MKWTSKAPDKAGWWWVKVHGDRMVVHVKESAFFGNHGLYALVYGSWVKIAGWWGVDAKAQWAGPIPEPEEEA